MECKEMQKKKQATSERADLAARAESPKSSLRTVLRAHHLRDSATIRHIIALSDVSFMFC